MRTFTLAARMRAAAVFCLVPLMAAVVAVLPRGACAEPLPGGLRLVMVEDQACAYCRRWLAEVGPYYASSREGRQAPLERRTIGDPSLRPFSRLVYTPTFLLVRDGREVDRLVGYPGAREFWTELDAMLSRAGAEDTPAPAPGLPPPPSEPRKGPDERDARLVVPPDGSPTDRTGTRATPRLAIGQAQRLAPRLAGRP